MKTLKTTVISLLCLLMAFCVCQKAEADAFPAIVPEIPVNACGSFTLYADEDMTIELGTASTTSPGNIGFAAWQKSEPGEYVYFLRAADGYGQTRDYKVVLYILVGHEDTLYSVARIYPKDSVSKVDVKNYELQLLKIDAEKNDGAAVPLAGAKFEIYRDGDVEGGKPKAGAAPLASDLSTGTDGTVRLNDLWEGSYWLRETKAPAGYHRRTSLIRLEISESGVSLDGKAAEPIDDSGAVLSAPGASQRSYRVTIENTKGSLMPGTGGIGTTLFYMLGGALLLAAGALMLLRKKSGSSK
jgi:LPXTG-motif cell wall-anchored protein